MTYEYNPSDSTHEIRNPYRIENTFLLAGASVLLTGSCSLLYAARNYVTVYADKVAIVTTIFALSIFGITIHLAICALSQAQFVFGRNFPIGLADELLPSAIGASPRAKILQETLRQQAIPFPEPQGALSGVLYSLVKPLAIAPPPIQFAAIKHFHTILTGLTLFASLGFSYLVFEGTPSEGIVSWLYLPFTGLSLASPTLNQLRRHSSQDSATMPHWLIGLVAFATLAPVLVPRYLPHPNIAPMWIAPATLLTGSLISSALFLKSLLSQLDATTQTSVTCEQATIAMNCLPNQLWPEISRNFQCDWIRQIPNRAYINLPPEIPDGGRGAFEGHVLEESQPQALLTMAFKRFGDAYAAPQTKYLIWLCVWGVVLSLTTICVAGKLVPQLHDMTYSEISRAVLTIFALEASILRTFHVGHLLWSKMRFKSRITWIETAGTFQTSELDVGNQFSGRLRSRSKLTRIEDATLRIWAADIDTVIFGKNSKRFIISMVPADTAAKKIAESLISFASMQSMIVVPTSDRDSAHTKNWCA